MPYAKVYRDITRSSINEEPLHVRWLFVVLLTACNRTGQVYGTIAALARLANISEEQAADAMERLQRPDPSSTTDVEGGRRVISLGSNLWQVVNYVKYCTMSDIERERELTRQRVRRYRERQRPSEAQCNGVTPGNADVTDKDGDRLTPSGLLALWNAEIAEAKASNPRVAIARAVKLSAARERHARARLKEEGDPEVWRDAIRRIIASPGCNGYNDRRWIADLDFLLRPGTLARVLEGKYDRWGRWPEGSTETVTVDEVQADGTVVRVEISKEDGHEVRRWSI